MEIDAGPVEQANDGGVDVPHLVGSCRAQPDLRFHGMDAEPGAAPAVLSYEAVPGGGGGPDRTEPLSEDRERAELSARTFCTFRREFSSFRRRGGHGRTR